MTVQQFRRSVSRLGLLVTMLAGAITATSQADGLGFARFDEPSDTIRVQGNTVFAQGDYTYEMRIRVVPGSSLGHVISEQRDTYEDKSIVLSGNGGYLASGCASPPYGDFRGTFSNFPPGAWIHFAYVHAGSMVYFYVNGVLQRRRADWLLRRFERLVDVDWHVRVRRGMLSDWSVSLVSRRPRLDPSQFGRAVHDRL